MALARALLAVPIAIALALAPVGSAFARFNGSHAKTAATAAMKAPGEGSVHVAQQDAGGTSKSGDIAMQSEHVGSGHCDHSKARKQGKATDGDCCDKQRSACAEFCLQKCFGQFCHIASDRLAAFSGSDRFLLPSAERLPDWVPALKTPPPRV